MQVVARPRTNDDHDFGAGLAFDRTRGGKQGFPTDLGGEPRGHVWRTVTLRPRVT